MATRERTAAPPEPAGRRRFAVPPAMRFPAYRHYWLGTAASIAGFQVFQFAQFILVHYLTGSYFQLAILGLVSAVPGIALNLAGGVLADRVDQRRLIAATQVLNAILIAALGVLTLLQVVQVWHVMVSAVLSSAVFAFENPARQAFYPRLVDRSVMTSAVALQSAAWQGVRVVGPALAGIIIATIGSVESTGIAAAFFFSAAGFVTMALVMASLRAPAAPGRVQSGAARELVAGLRFIRGSTVVGFLISMSLFNALFGGAYLTLMPVLARDVLGVGADAQGWLMSAGGVGSLAVTVVLGSRRNLLRPGLLLIGGAVAYGLLIAAFTITAQEIGSFPLALLLMFGVGVFLSVYMTSLMTTLQLAVPDQMRGRVMGIFGMTYAMMPLSGLQASVIATATGVPVAVAIGGLLVAAFALGPALLNTRIRGLATETRKAGAGAQAV